MSVFKRRWLMWDFARQRAFNRDEFLLVVDKLKDLGYNGLGLYLEGAFDFSSIDGILREGVMTKADAKWVTAECEKRGIFVFPMTNVVGHMEHFLRQERFKHLRAPDSKRNDIAFQTPEAEEFAMRIIHEFTDAFGIKYIHIGGDEVELTAETKPIYAAVLAKLCDNLLAEGIKPAIWNDMLWANKELCEPFSREVEIFDWYYYGHRPDSLKFFREAGFKEVVACPCENSWVGFINHQVVPHWIKGDKTPVKPDEIEAFLVDQVQNGDKENLSGFVTVWESTQGRDIWGQWVPLARAGLFMQGKYEPNTRNDAALEKALFGRATPYTEITYILQNEVQELFNISGVSTAFQTAFIRKALFLPPSFVDTLKKAAKEAPEYYNAVDTALDKAEALLKTWIPENEFEKRCVISMTSILGMARAAFALSKAAADCKKYYTCAAEMQFTEPQKAKELVENFSQGFRMANEKIKVFRGNLGKLIDCTGHTLTDLLRLDITMGYVNKIVACLDDVSSKEKFAALPLPAFEYILDWVVNDDILER